jgi:asparagine synthase (glutamine-hydrolysing)
VPVLLDGQGSDEMFMGYAKYQFHHMQDLLRCGRLLPMAAHMLRLLASGEHGGLRLWRKMQRYLPRSFRRSGALPLPSWVSGTCGAWESWRASRPSADLVARRDVTQWSLPLLLRYEDRNSMAHGVEARVPYVSWRVMRAARSIDPALHVRGGRVKSLLREAFAADLPAEIASRRTRLGFVTAWDAWVAPGGPLGEWAGECLQASRHEWLGGPDGQDVATRLRGSPSGRDTLLRWLSVSAWAGSWPVPISS